MWRRGALIAVLAAALATPLIAAASTSDGPVFKGTVEADENAKFRFEVLKNRKGKRRVDYPKSKRLNALCDTGPQDIDVTFGSPEKRAKISRNGDFNFDNSGAKYVVYVRGRISGRSAGGVLRYQGPTDFRRGKQDCDSGEVEWTAKKS
jgi:hypothetical protein